MMMDSSNNSSSANSGGSWFGAILLWFTRMCQWLLSTIMFRGNDGHSTSTVQLDTGCRVRTTRKIAEGGFSFVFECYDLNDRKKVYALKRLYCPTTELMTTARRERNVHRSLPRHDNLMPLLGWTVGMSRNDKNYCYLLFPLVKHSLRNEITQRRHLFLGGRGSGADTNRQQQATSTPRPWTSRQALDMFAQILSGVAAMHNLNLSHRDLKIDNVLLTPATTTTDTMILGVDDEREKEFESSSSLLLWRPVLVDYGSAGPLMEPVETRRDVMNLMDQAATHTTLPYRAPELLIEGGVRAGDADIDMGKADVWSLGCLLFAMLYGGTSPFEVEFLRHHRNSSHHAQQRHHHGHASSTDHNNNNIMRVVDCSPLRILGKLPLPPPPPMCHWYNEELTLGMITPTTTKSGSSKSNMDHTTTTATATTSAMPLFPWMLQQDRATRPSLSQVQQVVHDLLIQCGGTPPSTAFSNFV